MRSKPFLFVAMATAFGLSLICLAGLASGHRPDREDSIMIALTLVITPLVAGGVTLIPRFRKHR